MRNNLNYTELEQKLESGKMILIDGSVRWSLFDELVSLIKTKKNLNRIKEIYHIFKRFDRFSFSEILSKLNPYHRDYLLSVTAE